MAAASSYMVSPMVGWREPKGHSKPTTRNRVPISAQANEAAEQLKVGENEQAPPPPPPPLRPVEVQQNVKSKNMSREYGGQWLSSVTRHVRIYAAYIDPITCEFDQTQMDKLTLILDPSNEFLWNPQTCNKVYAYFQELVDHYEGAPLTEYTLRLIGSDIEHYIRKMLYDGEIKYNMNAKVLNFSMGKPRIMFNNNDLPQPNQ
ncbi:NAD(P)H-quinone oxidoreductase subunit M, chloroplastic [Momordica charantia]|uniref:NAD(P)H-quinone oxidoreductase subunit M, chloroplastic n=1 Tax=Momordica charantia TaxID=3673 RepID=A0A6J1CG25_MOMCH|nr:NAD(P)H-quinone oxidoreductase subunit M, chloroplastic [Momordica charantia]